jgi:hypothetical protein
MNDANEGEIEGDWRIAAKSSSTVEENEPALLNSTMKYDITMSHPTCGIRGDQDNGIYICEGCRGEFCGCCIGLCEGCRDLVCAECGDPGPPFDPGCPPCVLSLTTGDT